MPLDLAAPLHLRLPPQLSIGAGSASAVAAQLAAAGHRRIWLLTVPAVLGHAERFASIWREAGAVVDIVTDIPPEPTTSCAEGLRTLATAFAPDLVFGLGGGSVLDVAKVVAAFHDRPEPIADFYGIGVLTSRRTKLVCVPTTAGTGSEVSPNSLLFDDATGAKKAVISPALVPDIAIVDPELMTTLPAALTATTGIDALSHCLESYANRFAHPAIDLYALEGVRLVGAFLARAVTNGADLEARAALATGSLYGGLCLGPVNTAAVHALAYPLGSEFHMAHGLSIALLLPHVVRFNLPAMPGRYAALARALGATAPQDEAASAELPDRLTALIQACGIPTGLAAHGVTAAAIPGLAAGAMAVTRLLKNNPRDLTAADAESIYQQAL